jgi:chemotaxis methyl-accepting protein methylase
MTQKTASEVKEVPSVRMSEAVQNLQKSLAIWYLWLAGGVWKRLPASVRSHPMLIPYGAHLHSLVLKFSDRRQNHSTFFLRNRAELELLHRLAARAPRGGAINVAIIACSKGAEVYSIAWTLMTARPDLTINIHALDISQEIIDFAKEGVYSLEAPVIQKTAGESARTSWNTYRDQSEFSPFDRMSEAEKSEMFDRDGNFVKVKSWIKEGISWHCANAGDAELASILGRQDIVIANRFLCHMGPTAAERILRNLAYVVKPGGYLFISGVDLDVRACVAQDMKWEPVTELMKEVYDGDPSIRDGWPLDYWANEPFQAKRRDAMIRYASAFQIH